MKTQLLQDFDESGSAARPRTPETPAQPGAPPGPSMQGGNGGSMGGTATPSAHDPAAAGQMRPPGGQSWTQTTQSRQYAPGANWTGPRPLPPDVRAAAAAEPARERARGQAHAQASTAVPPPHPTPAADLPDWLTERLREDAEQEAERQRKRLMARRALGWSAAATLAAMLAVGGYWYYQDSRVEGALDVVANTTPAVPGPSAGAATLRAVAVPASVPASVPAATNPSIPGAQSEAARPAVPEAAPGAAQAAPPAAAAAMIAPVPEAPPQTNAGPEQPAGVPHQATGSRHGFGHRKQGSQLASRTRTAAARTDSARADGAPTAAQRREETLMQCRALGYDERECRRRGCMMTRFGLACPG